MLTNTCEFIFDSKRRLKWHSRFKYFCFVCLGCIVKYCGDIQELLFRNSKKHVNSNKTKAYMLCRWSFGNIVPFRDIRFNIPEAEQKSQWSYYTRRSFWSKLTIVCHNPLNRLKSSKKVFSLSTQRNLNSGKKLVNSLGVV